MLTVLAPGPLTTVQDRGRPGHAAIGVTRSGAADVAAAGLATRLVGNRPEAAVLEVTAGGLRVRAGRTLLVAVTGAPLPVEVDGRAAPFAAPLTLPAGSLLALGHPPRGLRSYVAVRGGIDVVPVLGSRSTDTLSGLGPPPLTAGTDLAVGDLAGEEPVVDVAPVGPPPERPVLRVLPGPRRDWLTEDAWATLTAGEWTVGADSDRVGLRLDGPRLARVREDELPSEGLVPGSVQVPPDGAPVLFLVDHPVTGGYPVAAVVVTADLPLAAQLRPGDVLRFRAVSP
ncbi:biotin-dependent carboxyltransferase family protein [Blastococcus sp. CCUG 61487]|uniref:5-oxoprolinase subunit C family protein n=1 Tax=Blastococcus sp. CCUG 61487 TaxID=1840703 RepID=UPI0010C134F4|nr:biotin-dependent carboxyltransferase family protein [Blastococcus sp. CCUG 61487]TKJ35552.1 allophanate hydrolase [Blastococcus sp. CCUG 61487]